MLEDNPFYNTNSAINSDIQQNNLENFETTENDTEETENTSNIQRSENVIAPEKEDIKTSTGVSSYTEVPSISNETIEYKNNTMSVMDRFNIWFVFIIFIWILNSIKKRKFLKIIEKTTNFLSKYRCVINIILLILTYTIFAYPKFFKTGISGKLDLFTMFEFVISISVNSIMLTFLFINFLSQKKILFNNSKTFSGIDFLEKSLITFSLTGLLFFFFTESQIALGLLYFFVMLYFIFYFMQLSKEKKDLINTLSLTPISLQISILGGLSGIYPIILFGAIIFGLNFQNFKNVINQIKTKE